MLEIVNAYLSMINSVASIAYIALSTNIILRREKHKVQ